MPVVRISQAWHSAVANIVSTSGAGVANHDESVAAELRALQRLRQLEILRVAADQSRLSSL